MYLEDVDEVEPALDYINHKSMGAFLKDVASDRQLIMITHLRGTIDIADALHGVRTRFDGSSFMKFYFVMDERLLNCINVGSPYKTMRVNKIRRLHSSIQNRDLINSMRCARLLHAF